MLYYSSLFDTEKAQNTVRGTGRFEEIRALSLANQKGFGDIDYMVQKYLERNGRRYVDMKGLFGFMEKIKL